MPVDIDSPVKELKEAPLTLDGEIPEWVKDWVIKARPYAIGQPGGPEDAICELADRVEQLEKEKKDAQYFANRWMRAALYSTPLNESTLKFDPTNPEEFGESRRTAVDALLTERDTLKVQVTTLSKDDADVKEAQ